MTQLRIYNFGPSSLTYLNTPFTIARVQTRALLYRLSVRMQPATREELGYLLWPDAPHEKAIDLSSRHGFGQMRAMGVVLRSHRQSLT